MRKTCSKYSSPEGFPRCLPSDATYVGSAKIGGVLDVDSYSNPSAGFDIQVTHKDCLYVTHLMYEADYETYGSVRFYNVTSTMADDSAFDIPSYCEKAQVVEDIRMLTAFRRFKSFLLK